MIIDEIYLKDGAHFSNCRQLRFALWRVWDLSKPRIMFIGLNPSTANENENDPTIRRVMGMAKGWGYGGIVMCNCFPQITTDPSKLQPVNLFNNSLWLRSMASIVNEIVFAWGNFEIVNEIGVDKHLKTLFPNAKCLIKNKNGSPRHPLYVAADVQLINF